MTVHCSSTLLRVINFVCLKSAVASSGGVKYGLMKPLLLSTIALLTLSTSTLAQETHNEEIQSAETQSIEKSGKTATQNDKNTISILHLQILQPSTPGTPSYLKRPVNNGLAGATIAIKDANITGKFLGYQLSMQSLSAPTTTEIKTQLNKPNYHNTNVVLLDAPSSNFQAAVSVLQQHLPETVIFNIANSDDTLRTLSCDIPLVHSIPSYQMKADALAQWFRVKRIKDIFALHGKHHNDMAYLSAFKLSAKKFKLELVDVKQWSDSFDLRRAAFSEIPQFTRTKTRYDAIFTADFDAQFAYALPFNTYYQVPVVGDAGLKPLGWHATHEQWGARQLQNRFTETFNRPMNEVDFAAYLSVISAATAIQQMASDARASDTKASQLLALRLLNDGFTVAAYRGRPLSIRPNTKQIRQPITLAHEDALVTHAPLEGFLHQIDELDTLGNINNTCAKH